MMQLKIHPTSQVWLSDSAVEKSSIINQFMEEIKVSKELILCATVSGSNL